RDAQRAAAASRHDIEVLARALALLAQEVGEHDDRDRGALRSARRQARGGDRGRGLRSQELEQALELLPLRREQPLRERQAQYQHQRATARAEGRDAELERLAAVGGPCGPPDAREAR